MTETLLFTGIDKVQRALVHFFFLATAGPTADTFDAAAVHSGEDAVSFATSERCGTQRPAATPDCCCGARRTEIEAFFLLFSIAHIWGTVQTSGNQTPCPTTNEKHQKKTSLSLCWRLMWGVCGRCAWRRAVCAKCCSAFRCAAQPTAYRVAF
ncbi:hypothetical protein DQ04_05571020 [Trypanosoma grayi]|uniref:hypothetical protein n=1 Tax=Trypanosoma grayi TaxID=71804 RepID=UPI0004F416A9|nr:hypothetical protein DQ04_05571020 [Trypanosoma grayi]KEG09230.1 hypothetical protein DQ04_05571020 [Trypanosoma grayi]